MLKRLLYIALLMGASLSAMEGALEEAIKAGTLKFITDETISAQLSQLLENNIQRSDVGQEDAEEGSPLKGAPKKVSSSAGELPRGSQGELTDFSEFDALKARVSKLVQERKLELDEGKKTKLVEEILGRLLQGDTRNISHSLDASDEADCEQTGPGAGCLIFERRNEPNSPGDLVKPPIYFP